ncbi:MAG TPA: hypothetical protein VNF73_08440 [Candidatus Saccharimonadales bacterium]|nr:hypothetical protein [Candidatus Saccharimonadales bacterium]
MSFEFPSSPGVVQRRSGTSIINIVLALAVLVAIGGVAFAVGRVTAPPAVAAGNGGFGRGGSGAGGTAGGTGVLGDTGGAGARRLGGFGGVTVQGTVTDVTSSDVTIRTASGTTVQIGIDGTTTYHQQAPGTQSDVAVGKTVLVQLVGFGGRRGAAGASGASGATGAGGAGSGSSGAPAASASGAPTVGPARDITVVGP